jgi:hypothetical protein
VCGDKKVMNVNNWTEMTLNTELEVGWKSQKQQGAVKLMEEEEEETP